MKPSKMLKCLKLCFNLLSTKEKKQFVLWLEDKGIALLRSQEYWKKK